MAIVLSMRRPRQGEPQSEIKIVRCDSSHDRDWNRFVEKSPRASFYHRAEWRVINERSFGHETAHVAAFAGEGIVGVLPIVRLRSFLFGNIACSMPFVNYGGPCSDSDGIDRALLAEAARVADEWQVDYLEVRARRPLCDHYRCSAHKVSMTVQLDSDPDRLFAAYKGDHRKDIRRAYKYGFNAAFGTTELFHDFFDVLSESWRDLGTPIYASSYLESVIATFPQSTRLCVVYDEQGTPAASALVGMHNGVVEGMWLGTRMRYRRQMVGYVLYWELIKDACLNGQRLFHLGRSTADSTAEQYKKKWNAVPTQLYWNYLLRTRTEIPQLNVSNRKYHLAIRTWQRLPVAVTRAVGPLIARSIP